MRRRLFLQAGSILLAQPKDTIAVSDVQTLKEIAPIVLPSLGRTRTDAVAAKFVEWVHGYRPGAEMEHGYGVTRLQTKPESPLARYHSQLDAIRAKGPVTKASIESILDEAQVKTLPRMPGQGHVIADLMSFFYQSPEGDDLCYEADIRRDECGGIAATTKNPRRKS